MIIAFFTGDYDFLSNFYQHEMTIRSYSYSTMEHYFQASKCRFAVDAKSIRRARSPREAKRLGRQVLMREDWEVIKLHVMLSGLRKKFASPRTDLGERLLATGDALLIEGNSWGDQYWGANYNLETNKYTGQNWLGSLLMVRRAELRSRL